MELKEKEFIRTFILELILVQKDSVFDLWDDESVDLPDNYLSIIDEILSDDVKKAKYASIIPVTETTEWKYNLTKELHDFLNSSGVSYTNQAKKIRINLNSDAIAKILINKKVSYQTKSKVACLAEDFLQTKQKARPKELKKI